MINGLVPLEELASLLKEKEGGDKKPYGDVQYADPGYQEDGKKRYPIDTEEHIRAAWNYISKPGNAGKYSSEQAASIKRKIVAAWKREIDPDGPPSAAEKSMGQVEPGLSLGTYYPDEVMAGEVIVLPEGIDAYFTQPPMGYNSTSLCVEMCVTDGKLSTSRLVISNYDSDPMGREEQPGSLDEAREQAHYGVVMEAIEALLLAGEPSAVAKKNAGMEGEDGDDLPGGDPKVPNREDLEPADGKKKKKGELEATVA